MCEDARAPAQVCAPCMPSEYVAKWLGHFWMQVPAQLTLANPCELHLTYRDPYGHMPKREIESVPFVFWGSPVGNCAPGLPVQCIREIRYWRNPTDRRNANFCICGEDLRMFGCCFGFVVVHIPNAINLTSGKPY